jgi:hypothetical protein
VWNVWFYIVPVKCSIEISNGGEVFRIDSSVKSVKTCCPLLTDILEQW